jgi:hypothetical protein
MKDFKDQLADEMKLDEAFVEDDGTVLELPKKDYNKFKSMNYKYRDSGKQVHGLSYRDTMEFLEQGIIEPVYDRENDFYQ